MDMTVEWETVSPHRSVVYVPADATHKDKLAAAEKLAASLTASGHVIRGTVRYEATDGTFGGSIT